MFSSNTILLIVALTTHLVLSQSNNTIIPTNITSLAPNLTIVEIYDRPSLLNFSGEILNYTYYQIPRKVAWYPAGNLAIIDGDIIFGTIDDLQAARVPTDGENTKRGYSLFKNELRKWPLGVFEYKWASEDLRNRKKPVWDLAVKMWTDRLPFLFFSEVEPPSATVAGVGGPVTLVDKADICPGCSFSWVGRAQSGESNVLTLGDCGFCPEAYAHEIGHSLGLHHEHQRPDRDSYITVHCENVDDQVKGGVVTKAVCTTGSCEGWGCALEAMPPAFADFSSPYDVHSLLHYRSTAFCNPSDCKQTITGIPPNPDPVDGLVPSYGDVRRICDLYFENCEGVCGDGILQNGEECDDGNNIDGDGCSADCSKEPGGGEPLCGNGIIDPGEQCDNGALNGVFDLGCDINCQKFVFSCPLPKCNPVAGKNLCHQTSSCITIEDALATGSNPTHLCACPHGWRGKGVTPGDISNELRIPGLLLPDQQGRVFVKPGVECVQLCDDYTLGADGCKEVAEDAQCFRF